MFIGKKILVVEDEAMIAMLVEDWLDELGARTVGPAASVAQALQLLDGAAIDAAVLDVNLGKERSDRVAQRLRDRGVPFVFATGYTTPADRPFRAEVITKPYTRDDLAAALESVMAPAE